MRGIIPVKQKRCKVVCFSDGCLAYHLQASRRRFRGMQPPPVFLAFGPRPGLGCRSCNHVPTGTRLYMVGVLSCVLAAAVPFRLDFFAALLFTERMQALVSKGSSDRSKPYRLPALLGIFHKFTDDQRRKQAGRVNHVTRCSHIRLGVMHGLPV